MEIHTDAKQTFVEAQIAVMQAVVARQASRPGSRGPQDYWTNLVDFGAQGDWIWMKSRTVPIYINWMEDHPHPAPVNSAVILDSDTGSAYR